MQKNIHGDRGKLITILCKPPTAPLKLRPNGAIEICYYYYYYYYYKMWQKHFNFQYKQTSSKQAAVSSIHTPISASGSSIIGIVTAMREWCTGRPKSAPTPQWPVRSWYSWSICPFTNNLSNKKWYLYNTIMIWKCKIQCSTTSS